MFNHFPKMIRNSNFFKTLIFSPTCSSAHVECNFDNSWNSFVNRPKKFVQRPKMIEERQFLKKFFPKIVLMDRWKESTLANPMKLFKQKAEKLRLIVQNWRRKHNLMRIFFPKKCSYSHVKGSFVNPVGTSSLEGQKFWGRRQTMIRKSFVLSSSTGGCSYGLSECSFLINPTKIYCKKGRNVSLRVGIW